MVQLLAFLDSVSVAYAVVAVAVAVAWYPVAVAVAWYPVAWNLIFFFCFFRIYFFSFSDFSTICSMIVYMGPLFIL
jgi:hypothetical protein